MSNAPLGYDTTPTRRPTVADTVPEDVREAVMLSLDGLPPVQDANLHFFKNDAPPPFDAPAIKAMARELLAYRKLLSSTPPSREWRTIDSAPKGEEHPYDPTVAEDKRATYVLYWNGAHMGVGYRQIEDGEPLWWDETGEPIVPEPTHWMPLPSPPVEADPIMRAIDIG